MRLFRGAWLRVWLYSGLAAGLTLTLSMVAARLHDEHIVLVAISTSIYAVAMSAFLKWREPGSLQHELLGAGYHPSLGLLPDVPDSWLRVIEHTAAYAGVAVCGLVLLSIETDSPGVHGLDDVVVVKAAAAFGLATLAMSASFALLGIPLVRRLGPNPPLGPTLAWFTVAAVVALLSGNLVIELAMPRLTSQPELAPYLSALSYTPEFTLSLFALHLLWRSSAVNSWRFKLTEQTLRAEAAEHGRRLAEAQLAMMQAQIEPHFLYNTLASVQYLVRKDAAAADFLLTQLIRYLRHAMPKLREPMSTLGQEFELADAYLQIARMRMGGRLTVSVELSEAFHDIVFPPLVLQTLVENALKHGVEPKVGPVHITVEATLHEDTLEVSVADSGVGLGRGDVSTAGSGMGLANIRDRLQGIYEGRAELRIAERAQGGVLATVCLFQPGSSSVDEPTSPAPSTHPKLAPTAAP